MREEWRVLAHQQGVRSQEISWSLVIRHCQHLPSQPDTKQLQLATLHLTCQHVDTCQHMDTCQHIGTYTIVQCTCPNIYHCQHLDWTQTPHSAATCNCALHVSTHRQVQIKILFLLSVVCQCYIRMCRQSGQVVLYDY